METRMSIERRRPPHVEKAIKAGDTEAIQAMAKAGGEATAKRWDERHAWTDMEAEMHANSMHEAARERNDHDPDLLPPDL
jgi:hypothetical protein